MSSLSPSESVVASTLAAIIVSCISSANLPTASANPFPTTFHRELNLFKTLTASWAPSILQNYNWGIKAFFFWCDSVGIAHHYSSATVQNHLLGVPCNPPPQWAPLHWPWPLFSPFPSTHWGQKPPPLQLHLHFTAPSHVEQAPPPLLPLFSQLPTRPRMLCCCNNRLLVPISPGRAPSRFPAPSHTCDAPLPL
jgi:hypothetical protein